MESDGGSCRRTRRLSAWSIAPDCFCHYPAITAMAKSRMTHSLRESDADVGVGYSHGLRESYNRKCASGHGIGQAYPGIVFGIC